MATASELFVSLSIFENPLDPRAISQRLGISADVEKIKGERNLELVLPRSNLWTIQTDKNDDDVELHWSKLMKRLAGCTDDFISIAKLGDAKITVVIYVDGRLPSVIIPVSMSKFASDIGAVIDIDYYD
ncbi:DUF4279 domain-containing protein [Rhizobium sp. FKY42]|uniref:DUF4279 domain-containing protein n=1 Tax=Rhizobium sp. FKY42 TaxID=2562310 RepID=UPI0010C14DBF|nr:DUF4279 domain-containing protein [Rhizobium sp. FKY42]